MPHDTVKRIVCFLPKGVLMKKEIKKIVAIKNAAVLTQGYYGKGSEGGYANYSKA
jgi:hypothetical protein